VAGIEGVNEGVNEGEPGCGEFGRDIGVLLREGGEYCILGEEKVGRTGDGRPRVCDDIFIGRGTDGVEDAGIGSMLDWR
jgi:hypothetical protein